MDQDIYEYRYVELLGLMETTLEVQLNALGSEGWRLVSFDHGKRTGVFERRVRPHE
jgi:hypothetical protein